MNYFEMVKEKVVRVVERLDRPVVRKRIDAEVGIYGDEDARKAVVGLRVDGAWMYKLSSAIGVIAVGLVILWLACRVGRFFRRLF